MPRHRPDLRRRVAALGAGALLGAVLLAGPAALAEGPALPDRSVRVVPGAAATVSLLEGVDGARSGSARLMLDGLPAGTVLTADGHRAMVPQQGTWQIAADGTTLTFAPFAPRLGQVPAPIRYSATAADGTALPPAVVTVTAPIIADLVRAAPFGEPVVLPLAETLHDVDPASLRLEPLEHDVSAVVEEDGTRVRVPEQGTWTLDRASGTVVFAPDSADVTAVAPVRLSGTSPEGESAGPALLEIGYPALSDLAIAQHPGQPAQLDLLDGSRNVRADSLRLTAAGAPAGSVLSEDGLELTVPGEGVWRIDQAGLTASFSPDRALEGYPSPVAYTAAGLYADATASGLLVVQCTQTPPLARADELRGRPGSPLEMDLLANDTPGAASVPLDPSSVRLRAPGTEDVPQLSSADGTSLVVPDQGEYRVSEDGVLTFTPQEGFRGSATPIAYTVADAAGVRVDAGIAVDIDPQVPPMAARSDTGGINSMLAGLRVPRSSPSTVFLSGAALLVFAGATSLGIGARMQSDRRSM